MLGIGVSIGLAEIILISVVSLATALTAIATAHLIRRYWLHQKPHAGDVPLISLSGGRVVSFHPDFRDFLNQRGWDKSPESLRPFFAFRFRGLPNGFPDTCDDHSDFAPRMSEDEVHLVVRRSEDNLTISLAGRGQTDVAAHVTRYRDYAKWLTKWVSRSEQNPIWVTDKDGQVIWANRAYKKLIHALKIQDGTDGTLLSELDAGRSLPDREQRRFRVTVGDDGPERWIDVSETIEHDFHLYHATDVTAVVQAETAQHAFVQTLTKTFAQLSIGLAIFDRKRQLALFNPALVDLTGLPPDFLSGRPGYLSFFDKLRDANIMPEPRRYTVWRDKIFDLIAAAEDGRYQETWSLPQGRTYRVTGRPHPNGAVAFIVEDISGEVTLTRRFREQLDLSHSVIESLEEAVAVFSPQGVLSYTNAAYRDLWGKSTDGTPLDQSVSEVSQHWQDQCDASPVWGDFRDFAVRFDERAEWDAAVTLKDGRMLDCRFRPLNGGATLVTFRQCQTQRQMALAGTL